MNKESKKLKGKYIITHFRKDKIINQLEINNLITDLGLAEIINLSGTDTSSSASPFGFIGLGTGTTTELVTDTSLESEIISGGLQRVVSTVTSQTTTRTGDTLQISNTFLPTTSFSVTEVGIFNSLTSGVLLSHKVFGAINVVNGDKLNILYQLVLS